MKQETIQKQPHRFARTCLVMAATSVAAIGTALIPADRASAVQITYLGNDYDVQTVTGDWATVANQVTQSFWWANQTAAQSAASIVGSSLGFPNNGGTRSPWYARTASSFIGSVLVSGIDSNSTIVNSNLSLATVATYAYATPVAVPEPDGIAGTLVMGVAMGAGIACRHKFKLAQTKTTDTIARS